MQSLTWITLVALVLVTTSPYSGRLAPSSVVLPEIQGFVELFLRQDAVLERDLLPEAFRDLLAIFQARVCQDLDSRLV